MKLSYTSISIPKELFEKLDKHIAGRGFKSVSDFATLVFRTLLLETSGSTKDNTQKVREKLKALGYI